MSSQKCRSVLKKKAQGVRKSRFAQDLAAHDVEFCAVGALLALFVVIALFSSLHDAFGMLWGAIIGIIIFMVAMDRIEDRDRTTVEYGEAGSSSSVHNFSAEGYSGKLMIVPEGREAERKHFLEQVLEEMAGEAGVAEARSTYETFLAAAEDPYNDTGWDEPWSEALMASFNRAVEVVEERERGDG